MNEKGRELIFRAEVHAIIGCAMDILNGIGHGLHEKPYENALAVELRYRRIPCSQQHRFPVTWRDIKVGEFVPDLIAYDQIIIDTKTIERITDVERGKMLNYLKISGLELGLIINFKHSHLEWERIILTHKA